MARPKVSLISRRSIIRAGLDIVESEGVEALTVRHIAKTLDVNPASLYHYFDSKDDILAAVTRSALAEMYVPDMKEGDDWREWFANVGIEYWKFLVERPYMAELRARGYLSRADLPTEAAGMHKMSEVGIIREHQVAILDSMESFVIGSALMHVSRDASGRLLPTSQTRRRSGNLTDETFAYVLREIVVRLTDRFTPASS
jgi:TetR/AcrR family transcriptional regulator, tetracycline repressor protein